MDTKKILIVTWITAGILGVIAYFVVFYSGGDYVIKQNNGSSGSPFFNTSSTVQVPSSTTSTAATGSTSTSSGSSSGGSYASTYSYPPASWREGNETLSITGASLQGNQLTLDLEIDMGSSMECVPMNMRLLTDESGDLASPATSHFSFPETGTCQGAPNATYGGQEVVFNIGPASLPVFITTGGASNLFLQISTTTSGGITIAPPQNAG